jgi:Fic family protein
VIFERKTSFPFKVEVVEIRMTRMQPAEFKCTKAGSVIRTLQGYDAFVPSPPPREFFYTPQLVLLLSEADSALAELSGLGRALPNPDLLIAPYSRREAVASSRIEGTQADLNDLLLDELSPERTSPTSDVIEIRNYLAAMKLGLSKLSSLPMANRLIREMHAILLRDARGQHLTPGEFRRSQNWIGPPGSTIATATYVPPPVEEMHECLKHWEVFVNERDTMPPLVQCAIMHEQFEAIHPFLDGNGRIGRLLITLFLIERGRLSKPLLYLSSYIEAHRQEYYDLLQQIRTDGGWLEWVTYFLLAVRETARSACRQSTRLLALRDGFKTRLTGQPRALVLIDELFANPYLSVARAARLLNVTSPTASKTIDVLERLKMLHLIDNRTWGRVWVASPILSVLQEEQPAAETV